MIASNSWAALHGRDLLSIEWEEGANSDYDSAEFRQTLLDTVRQPGTPIRDQGDIEAAIESAQELVEAEYYESVALYVQKHDGSQPAAGEGSAVALAPLGEKPGVAAVDTTVVKATVIEIDYDARKVVLKVPDGRHVTLSVDKDAPNLGKVKQGDGKVHGLHQHPGTGDQQYERCQRTANHNQYIRQLQCLERTNRIKQFDYAPCQKGRYKLFRDGNKSAQQS